MSVYFIQSGPSGDRGVVKIGHSANPIRRMSELQSAVADQLHIIRMLEGGQQAEQSVHQNLAHLHIRGELFEFSEEMLTRDFGFRDLPFRRALSHRERACEAQANLRAVKEAGGSRSEAFAAWARIVANGSPTVTIPKMSRGGAVEQMTIIVPRAKS